MTARLVALGVTGSERVRSDVLKRLFQLLAGAVPYHE